MNYYRHLVKKGIQFDFICMYSSLAYEKEIKELGGEIFYVPNVKKHMIGFEKKLKKIISENQYSVVHINMLSAANIVPLKVAFRLNVPKIIVHSHNTNAPGYLRNFLHKKNMSFVHKYATDFWACSYQAAKWLYGEKNADSAVVIQNAVEVEKFLFNLKIRKQIRERMGIKEDTLVLGHVGRMEEQKNHTFLLDIFHTVLRKHENTLLLLVGDGILREELQKKAEMLGIQEKVKFLGRREDINKLFNSMDVFVFPSLYEGLSVTVIEAQCAGLPCLASTGVVEETIVTDIFERLSLNESKEQWAEKILDLAKKLRNEKENDRIYKKITEAGFNIEVEAEKVYDIIKHG